MPLYQKIEIFCPFFKPQAQPHTPNNKWVESRKMSTRSFFFSLIIEPVTVLP